jgi:hypothetical protein
MTQIPGVLRSCRAATQDRPMAPWRGWRGGKGREGAGFGENSWGAGHVLPLEAIKGRCPLRFETSCVRPGRLVEKSSTLGGPVGLVDQGLTQGRTLGEGHTVGWTVGSSKGGSASQVSSCALLTLLSLGHDPKTLPSPRAASPVQLKCTISPGAGF